MSIQSLRGLAVLAALSTGAAGCIDLDVTNTQAPDRDEALANADAFQTLIASSFEIYFDAVHGDIATNHLFANLGTQNTTTTSYGAVGETRQPRVPFNNAPDVPAGTGPLGPRNLFASMNSLLSTTYDGLRAIRVDGQTFTEDGQDVTARAEAYAKLMQGLALGTLAITFDQAIVIPETEELESDVAEQIINSLRPHDEVLDAALTSLDEAIAIANANSFSFPSSASTQLWFGAERELDSQDLAQYANTMAARFLVLSARTPQDRANLDWNRVLDYTANGLQYDFEVTLSSDKRSTILYSSSQALIEVSFGTICCYRIDYKVIGPADTSGRYQEWIASDLGAREPFLISTPDRRITGTLPYTSGSYVRYRSNHNGFNAVEGLYRRSSYQWGRHAIRTGQSIFGSGYQAGAAVLATADENNLLRAEALLRTGDPGGAADLINLTRTRPQVDSGTPNLPAVTAAGVPESDDCVPRTDAGACGSLMTALRYERLIETLNYDALYGWADMRGFGMLPDGTYLHLPIPGNELDLLQLPIYTFGGVGSDFGAVYSPVDAL